MKIEVLRSKRKEDSNVSKQVGHNTGQLSLVINSWG